jgi:hypothetical protein
MSENNENQFSVTPGYQIPLPGSQRPEKFRDLNDDELQVLVSLAINTLRDRGLTIPSMVPQASRTPNIYDNAKFEQIACAGLEPKYDGSPEKLIPTLNAIHIRRQNEVWFDATFMVQDGSKLDMIRNFSQLHQETILTQAKYLWNSPDATTKRHVRDTELYNSRL